MPQGELSSRSSGLGYMLRALAAVMLFGGLAYIVDPARLWAGLARADGGFVAAGTLVFLAGQYLASQRWRAILASINVRLPGGRVFRLNMIGTFAGFFLPGQGSGDLVKCTLLFPAYPDKRPQLIASSIMDRLAGLAGTLLMALVGAVSIGVMLDDWLPAMQVAGIAVGGCLTLAVVVLAGRAIAARWPSNRLVLLSARFAVGMAALPRRPLILVNVLVLSLIFQLSWAICLWFMLRAVAADAPLWPVLCVAPLSMLIAAIPVSLGGLGLREGAFSLMMSRFGVAPDLSMSAALLSLLPIFIAAGAGALFLLASSGRGSRLGGRPKDSR